MIVKESDVEVAASRAELFQQLLNTVYRMQKLECVIAEIEQRIRECLQK
jgi:hypothetical protein